MPTQTQPTKSLSTVDETAETLNVKPKTVRAWIAARRLGCVRLGRAIRVPRTEIERIIGEGTIPAREAL